jgi:hypothetical protein
MEKIPDSVRTRMAADQWDKLARDGGLADRRPTFLMAVLWEIAYQLAVGNELKAAPDSPKFVLAVNDGIPDFRFVVIEEVTQHAVSWQHHPWLFKDPAQRQRLLEYSGGEIRGGGWARFRTQSEAQEFADRLNSELPTFNDFSHPHL